MLLPSFGGIGNLRRSGVGSVAPVANKSRFPRRLIVSFFSGSITQEREAAYKALGAKARSSESLLIAAGETTMDSRAVPFAELRLAGESVGLSWVHPRDLSSALEILSAARADSIFLIPDTPSAELPLGVGFVQGEANA